MKAETRAGVERELDLMFGRTGVGAEDALALHRATQFVHNVIDARDNGFALVCSECGSGIADESDLHEDWCSR